MRIIIELEGGGMAQPEVVLRSTSPGQSTTDATAGLKGAAVGGGIDAGPAPLGDQGTQTQTLGGVVAPSAVGADASAANSAGAAPSSVAGG